MNLQDYIIDVPDWPKEGIVFKDITPLLKNANALNHATLLMRGLIDKPTPSYICLLYTSPSPRDVEESRMPSSA